jgi:ABC-type branched-subunit amino acid transport system ATPase component
MPRKEERFMSKHFEYKSVLAAYIKGFIDMKEASGCNFLRGKWILFEIDRFFQENNILEPVITRELVRKWRKTKVNDSPVTIYSKYSIISQLARYMSRQGRECFIPRLPGFGSSKWNFTPYIFTHKQIDKLFCNSNLLRMYDRHMSNTMFSVPAVLRLIYSTGLRVSEEISIKNWRSSIGIIPQEIHIFNGTILQNLLTEYSEDKIKELLSMITEYGLGPFFDSFPGGLNTLVGEEGLNLSGGQKQIIAFIRAIFRNPDFLLVDEGTSNMDTGAEKIVINLIKRVKSKMGIMMISHKVNMVKKISDRIYVLDNGSITASGLHENLLKENNLYKRFWDDFY